MQLSNKTMSKLKVIISQVKQSLLLLINLIGLIIVYLVFQGLIFILTKLPGKKFIRYQQWLEQKHKKIIKFFDNKGQHDISRLILIDLSLQNLASKKSRSLITIGGMAVGIGSIVFLVSIGYGLQNLVVSRVARLEELKQADVIAQPNSELKLDDETLSKFQNLQEVEQALPLISVVGRVEYQQAMADMAVYGVTSRYLQQSAIKPIKGQIYDSNDLSRSATNGSQMEPVRAQLAREEGKVAGVTITRGQIAQVIQKVLINIEPDVWLRVRQAPTTSSKIIGYTKRPTGQLTGFQVWGEEFSGSEPDQGGTTDEGEKLSKWVKTKVDLWQKTAEGYQVVVNEFGAQQQKTGYIAQLGMEVEPQPVVAGQVLGVTSQDQEAASASANQAIISASGDDWVELATVSAQTRVSDIQKLDFGSEAKRKVVVNQAALSVLGIKANQAVGQEFTSSFVVMGKALGSESQKAQSVPTKYQIVGVIPGEQVPILYVPFIDLRSLGIVNYDQVKLVTASQKQLKPARQKVEAMGYVTRSVTDTVAQIESIFGTTRLVLAFLGMAALLVASLGMFNTLTVSLLERTREVGLMKALGMKSEEVRELFMIESLTMGLLGGIAGIVLGFVAGKLLSLGLSVFSLVQGVGVLDVALIPLTFIFVVLFLAIMVGIITGLYPAKRATHISALNALRYE